MTNIVLLSAGQGRRLSPLTDNKPKCLVPISGKPLLEWQLRAIDICNSQGHSISQVSIVTGFKARSVETALKTMSFPFNMRCIYNPFYSVADNIGSCWAALDILKKGSILINGDTLFDPAILSKLLQQDENPVVVSVDKKQHYDDDDMKVQIVNSRLKRIGKRLHDRIDGESIGMLRFDESGGSAFAAEIEALLQDPASLNHWYLSIIDRLASRLCVGVMPVNDLSWQEIDFPHDLAAASHCISAINWERSKGFDGYEKRSTEMGCQ